MCCLVCPTGAITKYGLMRWRAIEDEDKFVVVQTAPAIQASIGEEFGLPAGTVVTGKLVTV